MWILYAFRKGGGIFFGVQRGCWTRDYRSAKRNKNIRWKNRKGANAGDKVVAKVAFGKDATLKGEIIEVLGKEKTLYVKLSSGKDLVITVPGHHPYETGEKHKFGFDLEALHFFDAETELRIN